MVRFFILLTFIFFPCLVNAYEIDYNLDDHFIMETTNTRNKIFEIWNINLLRGSINAKEHFIDFDLVRILLSHLNGEKFIINDIYTYEYSPSKNKVKYNNGSFSFEFGTANKTLIEVQFNKDGTLRDITGSITNLSSPGNVTIFKLSKGNKELNIAETNKFTTGLYNYTHRTQKK